MKRANRYGRTYHNYRKALLLKTQRIEKLANKVGKILPKLIKHVVSRVVKIYFNFYIFFYNIHKSKAQKTERMTNEQ